MQLTAEVLTAGVFPQTVWESRPIGIGTPNRMAHHEKGGWIRLKWEVSPGKFTFKTISVSRARAEQAMRALLYGRFIA